MTPEPPKVAVDQSQGQAQGQGQQQGQTSENTLTGSQETVATGTGTGTATASNDGVTTTVDAADRSSTTTSNKTSVYALGLDFPNLDGCLGGAQGGGSNENVAGFLGLNLLNVACWMQKLSESEDDLESRASLKCYDNHYRRAINLNDRSGTKTDEMRRCMDTVIPRWRAQLEQERQAAEKARDELTAMEVARIRQEATENLLDLTESHRKVCEESLERCEKEAYGSK